jgi:hypothetical protein
MQDLTLVGLNKDGTRLVLVSSSGEEFSVPVDTRLRAALRGQDARLGQLETKMDSALRPRDIQARIRAGESAEDVAAAAQTTVDAIMPFAGPVLAERQHVAQTALKGSLRRRSSEPGSARTLGEAAELYFAEHSLHDEDVEWDAWRRPDGRWALVATYAVSGRPRTAEFTHDQPGRYVVAENDDARLLTGELRAPDEPGTAPRAQARRLSPVPTQDELPLGDDAIQLVRDQEVAADPSADRADADWLTEAPEELATPTEEPLADPVAEQPADEPLVPEDEVVARVTDEPREEPGEGPGGEPVDQPAEEDTVEVKRSSAKRKGRSSVPSWDEIMFGGGKDE